MFLADLSLNKLRMLLGVSLGGAGGGVNVIKMNCMKLSKNEKEERCFLIVF